MLPYNFGDTSAWKGMLRTCLQWRIENPNMHILFLTFPFLSCLNVEPDELHVIHIGTSQYLLGSVLWLLVFVVLKSTPDENIRQIWSLILDHYTRHQTSRQFSSLTLSSFMKPTKIMTSYPKLEGKGAEIRHLVMPLSCVWKLFKSPHDQEYNDVTSCLEA